jgi:hypothetical protein
VPHIIGQVNKLGLSDIRVLAMIPLKNNLILDELKNQEYANKISICRFLAH